MSSFLDRFRGVRQESARVPDFPDMKKNKPPTYVSDFILEGAWNRDEPLHQGNMARRDPCAWNITTGIANNVFDDWFKFIDPKDDEKEIMQEIQKEFERLDARKWLSLALAGERTYGFTWLQVGMEDSELRTDDYTGPPRVVNLDVFTPEYCTPTEFDDIGYPTKLGVQVLTNAGNTAAQYTITPIDADECILFRTRPYDRSHEGLPVTYSVWNALCGLNFTFHAIISYNMKIGVGALVLKTKAMASAADVTAAENMMEDLSVTRIAIIPGSKVESLEYIGAGSGTTAFSQHIQAFREEIAAGSKIPIDVIIGTSAGAITGSEVNSKALYAVIQGEQSKMEPYIRELVRRMGYDAEDYVISWNTRYATDEMQQAQIRVLNAQADEAEQRITNMKEGKNDIQIGFAPGGQKDPEDEKENKNPSGTQ